MDPSEEAQARRQPHSWGAQETRLTDAEWRVDSKTFWKLDWEEDAEGGLDRQMRTRPS